MTHEQTAEEIRQLKSGFTILSKSVDLLNANLLLKAAQFEVLKLSLGKAIAAAGADKTAGVNWEDSFNATVRALLHESVLEMGDDGSPVAEHIQRVLSDRGILPDWFGIGST